MCTSDIRSRISWLAVCAAFAFACTSPETEPVGEPDAVAPLQPDAGVDLDADTTPDAGPIDCVVPGTHDTLQAAVDDVRCFEVRVQAGTYLEHVVVGADSATRAIRGDAAGDVVLDGGGTGRVLRIDVPEFELSGVTVVNGRADEGAGIRAERELTLRDVVVAGNVASSDSPSDTCDGGGVLSRRALTVEDSSVRDNRAVCANGRGGGIAGYATVDLIGTDVADNEASGSGGGVFAFSAVQLRAGSVSGNVVRGERSSLRGGGIEAGTVVLSDGARVHDNRIEMDDGDDDASRFAAGCGIDADRVRAEAGTRIDGNRCELDVHSALVRGAGIRADGVVELIGADVTDNRIDVTARGGEIRAFGGGISLDTSGASLLDGARVERNEVRASCVGQAAPCQMQGGGIAVESFDTTSSVTVVRSEVSDNRLVLVGNGGSARGAGMSVDNQVLELDVALAGSTLAGNRITSGSFGFGGAVYSAVGFDGLETNIAVENTTVSGNVVDADAGAFGGAFAAAALFQDSVFTHLDIRSATIAFNQVASAEGDAGGAALFLRPSPLQSSPPASVANSIVAGNVGDDAGCDPDSPAFDIDFSILSEGHGCLILGASGLVVGADPALSPLASNGGPTRTHAIAADSPAVDAGDPEGCRDTAGIPLPTDQRGVARGVCDIGAFELAPAP